MVFYKDKESITLVGIYDLKTQAKDGIINYCKNFGLLGVDYDNHAISEYTLDETLMFFNRNKSLHTEEMIVLQKPVGDIYFQL